MILEIGTDLIIELEKVSAIRRTEDGGTFIHINNEIILTSFRFDDLKALLKNGATSVKPATEMAF